MRFFAVLLVLSLSGCVSTEMRSYIGKDISEVLMAYGQPEQVFDLPDGRKAFQFRQGAGTALLPGHSQSTVQSYGNIATVNTTATPAMAVSVDGCLLTFIASAAGNSWTISDIRVPKDLVC